MPRTSASRERSRRGRAPFVPLVGPLACCAPRSVSVSGTRKRPVGEHGAPGAQQMSAVPQARRFLLYLRGGQFGAAGAHGDGLLRYTGAFLSCDFSLFVPCLDSCGVFLDGSVLTGVLRFPCQFVLL